MTGCKIKQREKVNGRERRIEREESKERKRDDMRKERLTENNTTRNVIGQKQNKEWREDDWKRKNL